VVVMGDVGDGPVGVVGFERNGEVKPRSGYGHGGLCRWLVFRGSVFLW
jgi:hypothetical protein